MATAKEMWEEFKQGRRSAESSGAPASGQPAEGQATGRSAKDMWEEFKRERQSASSAEPVTRVMTTPARPVTAGKTEAVRPASVPDVPNYDAVRGNEDFLEESAVQHIDQIGGTAGVFSRDNFLYINDRKYRDFYNRNVGNALDAAVTIYDEMTPEEIAVYNYLCNTEGWEKGDAYLDQLEPELNRRQGEAALEDVRSLAREYPVAAGVLSVPLNLMGGAGTVDVLLQHAENLVKRITTGAEFAPIDYNTPAVTVSKAAPEIRKTQAEMITDRYGTIQLDTEKHPVLSRLLNGKSLGNVYQMGMSMADSGTVALMSPVLGKFGAVLLGGSAATQGMLNAVEKGATDGQALIMGLASGTFEMLFEKYSLDKLLGEGGKNIVLSVLKQGFVEGTEELFTSIANLVTDTLVMMNKSDIATAAAGYREQGLSEGNAYLQATIDTGISLLWDFVGGMATGGVMGGGSHVIRSATSESAAMDRSLRQIGQKMQQGENSQTEIQMMIMAGLNSAKDSKAYQVAHELRERFFSGKRLSDLEVGRLFMATWETAKAEQAESQTSGKTDEGIAASPQEVAPRNDVEAVTENTAPVAEQLRPDNQETGGFENGQEEGFTPAEQEAGRAGVPDGGSQRVYGQSAGKQAGGLGAGAESGQIRDWAGQVQRANQIQNLGRSLPYISAQDVGVTSGTAMKNLKQIPEKLWDAGGLRTVAEQIREDTGLEPVLVIGKIQVKGKDGKTRNVRGVYTGSSVVVQVNHPMASAEKIADHEIYHHKTAELPLLHSTLRQHIVDTFTEEEFSRVLDVYIDRLNGAITLSEDATGEEFEAAIRQIEEEIFADAYAGINAFGAGADRFTESVHQKMDELYVGKTKLQDNGARQTNGPNGAEKNTAPEDGEEDWLTVSDEEYEERYGRLKPGAAFEEKYSYAGENAKNADLESLARAKEMHRAGVANETIRLDTGWFRGMDGKWRWEIDDSGMRYDSSGDLQGAESAKWAMEDYESARDDLWDHADMGTLEKVRAYNRADIAGDDTTKQELYDELINGQHAYYFEQYVEAMAYARGARNAPAGGTLQDYIDHPALFKAYPQLRNVTLRFERMGGGMMGYYSRTDNEIVLNTELRHAAEDTLVHEIQHAIQKAEGFTRGSNEEYWEEVQNGEKPVRANDRRIAEAERKIREILDSLPPYIAGQFELHRHLEKSDPDKAMELADQLSEGLYGDQFSDYFLLTWDLELAKGEPNYIRGAGDLYRNTAGEIEARDAAGRRTMDAEGRKKTPPSLGGENTVFVEDIDGAVFAELDAQYGPQLQSAAEFDQDTISGNIRQVAQMESVTGITGQEFAKGEVDLITQVETFFDQRGNRAFNPELGEVILDRKGVKSDIAHGIGRKKAAAFAAVPEVIERGLVVDYQKNWKGRGYDTAVVAAPIDIGGQAHMAAIILVRSDRTNRFYVHEVLAMKNGAMPFKTGARKGDPSGDAPSILSILDKIRSVKNGSTSQEKFSVDDGEQDYDALEREFAEQQRRAKEDFLRQRLGDDGYRAYLSAQRAQEKQEAATRRAEEARIAQEKQQAADHRKEQAEQRRRQAKTEAKVRRQVETNKRKLHVEAETAKINHEEERRLREETAPTKAKKAFRDNLLNLFSIPDGKKAELGKVIDGFAERIIKNGSLTEADRSAFFDRMYESGVMTVHAEDYFQEGRRTVAGGKVYVDDSLRADFGDDWDMIRRRAFAAGIYLTNNQADGGLDMWNHELAELLPGLFDSEETDNRAILERIVEIAEEGRDEKVSLAEYTHRLARTEHIPEQEFLDQMERQMDWALGKFAESAGIEMETKARNIRQQAATRRQNIQLQARLAAERQERVEKAQRQRERQELRELQQKTLKSLQWLNRNQHRAPEELQEKFREILSDIDIYAIGAAHELNWSDKHNASWRDLAQMYKDAKETDPNFLPSKELEMIVARLDGTKIADMDPGALADLYKAAVGLRTEFYNRNNVIDDEYNRLFAEVYTDSKKEIEGAPGGFTGKEADKFLNMEQLTPMNVLQRMAGWDRGGVFYSMAQQLERGERDVRAFTVKAQARLRDFLTEHEDWVKKADGQGKDGLWEEIEIPELVALELGKPPKFGDTIKVWITPAQKVHMYLESKNQDNLRHMTGGRTFADKKLYSEGKRQEAYAQGKTVRLAPETVKAIVAKMTPEELELARLLDSYYNGFATEEINRVSNILYGYDKAMGSHYAPIYTNRNYVKTEFGVFDQTAEGVGNLKGRVYAVNPSYNISAFDAFERNVEHTARFVGMAIPARNWTTLMNWREQHNSTADVITHKWGEEGKAYISDLITTLQAGEGTKGESVSRLADTLLSNYISSVFGANPSIVLKQLGSIPMAAPYLGIRNAPTLRQVGKIDRGLIAKYTSELEWRTMGYSTPETKQLKDNPNWTETNKFTKFTFGGGAITAMDGWAASVLWPWAENKVRNENQDLRPGSEDFYRKVAEEFEYALVRSQSVSDEMHQSTLRKSKNLVTKTFTMFRSDSAQTYNALRQMIGEAKFQARTGGDAKALKASKKAIGTVVCAMITNAVWAEAISFLMAMWKNKGKYYRDEEEELTAQSVIGEMARNMLESIAGTVTFGDELAQLIGNVITGDKRYDLEAPGMEQINDIFNMVNEILQGGTGRIREMAELVANDGDLGEYLKRNSGEILGELKEKSMTVASFFGIPVSNVEAYVLGIFKNLSPAFEAAYEDAFRTVEKGDLKGLEGDVLEARLERLLQDRQVAAPDDTLAALAELYQAGYTGAVPGAVPKSVTIDGENVELNIAQQQTYEKIWAGTVAGALEELVGSSLFADADAKEQEKLLKRLYDYAAETARAEAIDGYEMNSTAEEIAGIVKSGGTLAEAVTMSASLTNSEIRNYHELIDAGVDQDLAYEVVQDIAELEPMAGEKEVLDVQKWRECIDRSYRPATQMSLIYAYMTPQQYSKLETAFTFDVDPDVFVGYYEIRERFDANGNGNYSNAEIQAAIDSMGGYNLSDEQKAVLWQLMSSSKSAKNNPYSVSKGTQVLEYLSEE